MPPRYVYWTIIVDGQPTAFRSGSLEDIMPTFNRLKEKQPTAELKWFQSGKLWASRHDAQESLRGPARTPRPAADAENPRPERAWNAKPEWKTRSTFSPRSDKPSFAKPAEGKPEWKPKGSFTPLDEKPRSPRSSWGEDDDRPSFVKASADRPAGQARGSKPPEWKPKGSFKPREPGHSSGWGEKPAWKSESSSSRKPPAASRDFGDKPAWKPKGDKPAWKSESASSRKPQAASRDSGDKPAWKPKSGGSARDQARSSFRPKSYTPKPEDDGMTRSSRVQSKNDKLEWKPKGSPSAKTTGDRDSRPRGPNAGFAKSRDGGSSDDRRGGSSDPPASDGPKRKWVPKAEYKKSLGIEPKKDAKWRPGGDHVDPKQKYKDAKKAKWGRFKEAIRSRSSKPRGDK